MGRGSWWDGCCPARHRAPCLQRARTTSLQRAWLCSQVCGRFGTEFEGRASRGHHQLVAGAWFCLTSCFRCSPGSRPPSRFALSLAAAVRVFFYVSDPLALPVSDHICVSAFSGAAVEMDRIRGTPNVVRQTLLLSGLLAPGSAGRGKGCAPSPASGCRLSVLQPGSAGRDAEGSAGRQKEPSSDPVPLPQRNPGKGNWGREGEFSLGAPAAVPAPMMEKGGTGEVSTPAAGELEGAWEHPQTSLGGVSGSGRAALRRNWAPRQCRREPALRQRGGFAPLSKRSHRLHGGQEARPGGEQGSSRGHPAWGCHRCVGGSAGGWVGAG